MPKKTTEAQKKASLKYQRKLAGIAIKVQPEQRDKYNAAAAAAGVPLRQFILQALDEKIQRDNLL
ncbi:MAG: cag pathogenicity island protein [Clostridia bacterium]|nr:cag pathogenicity island protein [Clostridia bacterium]